MLLNIVLWVGGAALIGFAAYAVRRPYDRYRGLQAADENARRYDSWRGGVGAGADSGTTGADVMRAQLRAEIRRWVIVAVVGVVLIVAGFALR